MGSFGGFYKGEKKKPKTKDKKNVGQSMNAPVSEYNAPTFTMPEVISKKKPGE